MKPLANVVFVVLDDDPTGVQVVSDVTMLIRWNEQILEKMIQEKNIFYILTNSRALSETKASQLIESIVAEVLTVAQRCHKRIVFMSRGDSTLRGHYPLEPDIIKETFECITHETISGELFIPFFEEGKRVTRDDIHYIQTDGKWIPVGKTEYAKDDTFGYKSSNLQEYILEKSQGKCTREDIFSLSNLEIRKGSQRVFDVLSRIQGFKKIVCNVETLEDAQEVANGLTALLYEHKNYVIRCAPTFPKVLAGLSSKEIDGSTFQMRQDVGGLVVVGSHVSLTTKQLNHLIDHNHQIVSIEFNTELLTQPTRREAEIQRVINLIDFNLAARKDVCLFTSRKIIKESQHFLSPLEISLSISSSLTKTVANLKENPRFICAKGGITSSDLLSEACNMQSVNVVGQILKGVTLVMDATQESRFKSMPFVIFPGNVGEVDSLTRTVNCLSANN